MVYLDPVLEHYNLKHKGAINRFRAMPQSPQILITWTNVDTVSLYNVKGILENSQQSSNTSNTSNSKKATANPTKIEQDPFFVYQRLHHGLVPCLQKISRHRRLPQENPPMASHQTTLYPCEPLQLLFLCGARGLQAEFGG